MATKILMEALSPTMEEGRLVEWKKREGESVAVGEILAEVETDKAVMDLVARASGTLLKRLVPDGTTVPVSAVVGVIGATGEDVTALVGNASVPSTPTVTPNQPARAAPPQRPAASPAAISATPASQAAPAGAMQPAGRVKASPLAKRMAADQGVDLTRVSGSGPEGRIIARDLAAAGRPGPSAVSPPISRAPLPASGFVDAPLTQLRKTIAKRLAQSIGPIPTYYLTTEIDMERTWEAREALNASATPGSPKISLNDIVIKTTALALREHPACNAWWMEDRIRYWHDVHVSMAVAVEDGLITPVLRHADRKSLREISAEARDLAGRARERKLALDEYTGGTFSISNLGMFDIDQFTAVINPPEAGILAIGAVVQKPVVYGGQVSPRRRMRVTMSCDHRVIDGATGAAFLKTLRLLLENPLAMVW
jgi:pyruvate dehydrogenase E2 component (dihydrolipoamide acetyltransferase)